MRSRGRVLLARLTVASTALLVATAAIGAAGVEAVAASQESQPAAPTLSLMVPRAEKGLLLGIANTGEHLLAVGGNGDIVLSDDGTRWTQVPSPVDVTLTAVAFADSRHGWAVGHDAAILYTADGGRTWTLQSYQPELNVPLFSVLALDAQRALAVGAFGTLKSTEDGGAHWTDINDDAISGDKLHLNAVTRLANGDIFVVGEHGVAAISSDGRSWLKLQSPYEGSFFGVQPWGRQGVVAFGLRGNVYAMADARSGDWLKIDVHTTSSLFGGLAAADGDTVLVGSDGAVIAVDGTGRAGRIVVGGITQGQATTFAALVGYHGGLMAVGDAGVVRIVP